MNIHHRPLFDTQKVCEHYSKKDGVPVTYVCTTALNHGTMSVDVFYRETPHPEFGNRYFGLYMNSYYDDAQIMITNADCIEGLTFDMVNVKDQWHYSQHRHDFYTVGDVSIDGGRAYVKLMGNIDVPRASLKVVNGQFEKVMEDESL